ncbi:MAG: HAMP domain-containing protein [Deltaproteobacteria bacterium]|nr:HAMP domain-containing protein [Deltaproteobacteria bacterium]
MRKTRIFIKIYLWFWLATALVVATQMTLDHLTESGPPFGHIRHEVGGPLAFFGEMALDRYLRGESSSLSHLADLFKESTGIDAYLLDQGRGVGNRPLRDGSAHLAAMAAQSGTVQIGLLHDLHVVALPVSAGETGRFIVVGEAAFRPPPPPFMRPPLAGVRIFIVLTVSGLVCYGLARYLTSPVIVLRQATRCFAAGDLGVRVGRDIGKRKDEFSELAGDFNHMAEQIGSLMTLQKQLLADISHELRSPLARLMVALELARRASTGPEAEKALNRIEQEADLMNVMIGHLLTLRRIESGVEQIEMKPVDLSQMVRQIASDAAFEAVGKNRKVVLSESDECRVVGNEELLRRAVENVVRNAIRYTPENTSVDIRVRSTVQDGAAYAEIEVRDHGQGVPDSHIANLFRPFYRVSGARERNTGGAGLGLAITERALKLHHGNAAARNAPNGGLIVTIQLPLQ